MPKVFVSFSGSRSAAIGGALVELLYATVPDSEPWISPEVSPGQAGTVEIMAALRDSRIVVVILAPENTHEAWLSFEAGVVAAKPEALVMPLRLTRDTPIPKPLAELGYQREQITEKGIENVARSVANHLGLPFAEDAFQTAWSAFDSVVRAQLAVSALAPWPLERLSTYSRAVNPSERPFLRILQNRVLASAEVAVCEAQASKRPLGADGYRDRVRRELNRLAREPDPFVLALCGDKGFDRRTARTYFNRFYTFAENTRTAHPIASRVCRIFVQRKGSGIDEQNKWVLDGHRSAENERNGVLGLTLSWAAVPTLEDTYPGLADRLAEGFGFLLFASAASRCLLTHEGRRRNLTSDTYKAPASLVAAMRLWADLARQTDEYHGWSSTSARRRRLHRLLLRIDPYGE